MYFNNTLILINSYIYSGLEYILLIHHCSFNTVLLITIILRRTSFSIHFLFLSPFSVWIAISLSVVPTPYHLPDVADIRVPFYNASTPCSLQAFGIRCITSHLNNQSFLPTPKTRKAKLYGQLKHRSKNVIKFQVPAFYWPSFLLFSDLVTNWTNQPFCK